MLRSVLFLAGVAAVAVAHHDGCDHGEIITRAIARLEGNGVTGNITFTKQDNGKVRVGGRIEGLEKGLYGFHVHQSGDLSQGCISTKSHFNPDGLEHGHPHDEVRHAGDLGNVEFDEYKVAVLDYEDHKIALSGVYNIVGRAVVLHEKADDFGRSTHPDSKKTGNAGGRVACGVIGIMTTERVMGNMATTPAVNSVLKITALISILVIYLH